MKILAKALILVLLMSTALSCLALSEEDFDEQEALESIREMFAEDEETTDEAYAGELMINPDLGAEWMNILLMGTDNRSHSRNARTDAMIILSVNVDTNQVKMTSIMRDTWVPIPGKGHQKINAANVFGGAGLAMKTVNEYFGMNIEKYVLVNFQDLSEIIDVIGGIDLTITSGEKKYMNMYLSEYRRVFGSKGAGEVASSGNIHVTGAQATAYSRIRYIGSDYQRTQRQRTVLMEMAKKLKSQDGKKRQKLLPEIISNVETNLNMADMLALYSVASKIDLGNEDVMSEFRIPADGTFKSGMFGSVWCIKPNFDENAKLLREFIYGQ